MSQRTWFISVAVMAVFLTNAVSAAPKEIIIVRHGAGKTERPPVKIGDGNCRPGKALAVVTYISSGASGNTVKGTAICEMVATTSESSVPGVAPATFVDVDAVAGVQTTGTPQCVSEYTGVSPSSFWTVTCIFGK